MAGRLTGVSPELDEREREREQIATRLAVPTMTVLSGARAWGRSWQSRGVEIVAVLAALVSSAMLGTGWRRRERSATCGGHRATAGGALGADRQELDRGPGLGEMVDEFVTLVDAERAVRRQALHGERSGDTDDAPILVGLFVQVLEVRIAAV